MFRRSRGAAVAVAIAWATIGGVSLAGPVAAAVPADTVVVSLASAGAPTASPGSTATARPGDAPGERAGESASVAEKGGGEVTPLIMVAGLAMLFGAIFMVIRSGSSQRNGTLD